MPCPIGGIAKQYMKIGGKFHDKATNFYRILCGQRAQLHTIQSNQNPPFNVRRSEPELVRPSQPTPNKLKLLSDIDEQDVLRYTQPMIMFYPAETDMKDRNPAKVIKNALADALVHYYPWAGRMRDQHNQKMAVDCTAKGVVFGEADANISLKELGELPLLPPFPYLEQLLYTDTMEVIGCPMLTMQVTHLSCGGFILALRFNHVLSDGGGIVQFLTSITELARGASAPSILPVWQRDRLNSREPHHVTHKNHHAPVAYPNDMVHHNFSFRARDVATPCGRIQPHLQPCTDFELITSALWRCRTISLQYEPEEEVRLAFVASARSKFNPQLPVGYYGNAITLATAVSSARKIYCDNTLSYVMELVKTAKGTVREEYKRSLINPGILRGHRLPIEAQTYIISDLSQLGLSSLDFGWGKPVYSGPADNTYIPHLVSFIIPFRNENGEEVKVVPVYLPKDAMDRFAKALDNLLEE